MSTKSLMADKRVAQVTLNDAGKAATLTLIDPWTFEGSAGPFTLKNVEHGHQIVKGATGGVVSRAPRSSAPKAPATLLPPKGNPTEAMKRDPGSETPSTAAPIPPGTQREQMGIFVYRIGRVSDELNHEVYGWLKATRRWTPKMLAEHSNAQLCGSYKGGREAMHLYEDVSRIWTKGDEREARTKQTMGSPWATENINSGAEK